MRVLFRKIHCLCFCKPSSAAAAHLYTPEPLKLESSPHVSPEILSFETEKSSSDETLLVKDEGLGDGKQEVENEIILKSCIKKRLSTKSGSPKVMEKKRVQWVDKLGKELVDIRHIESSETGDTDSDGNRGCLCIIR